MLACALALSLLPQADDPWHEAEAHAAATRRAVAFCLRYAHGWLAHADPRSGLLPRRLQGEAFWNARDCAADNFPFLAMTAHVSGQVHLQRAAAHVFAQEQRLTPRLGPLPDDFVFATQALRAREPSLAELVFGAAEYCKDGLLPLFEWTGDPRYAARMLALLRDIAARAAVPSPAGPLPSANLEVNGDLLQAYSRAWWFAGDPVFRNLAFRLGDHYLLHASLLDEPRLSLRDHGCEVIGGLSEAYVVAVHEDRDRAARWRAPLRALLACIAAHGVRDDGLLHNAIDPRDGSVADAAASDGWGYVLDAFLTVAAVDGEARWREVAAECLRRVPQVRVAETRGLGGADGCADTLEGALNLLAWLPDAAAMAWVDREIEGLFAAQREDGVLEAWYGDGNSARTMWMWALAKTLGITVTPWRQDMALGAARDDDGTVRVVLRADFAWSGTLRCDRPRHDEVMRMPLDYARINQWPQWFAPRRHELFTLATEGRAPRIVGGDELWALPMELAAGEGCRLTIGATGKTRGLRRLAYAAGAADAARAWQHDVRGRLLALLRVPEPPTAPPAMRVVSERDGDGYRDLEIAITDDPGGRALPARLTLPAGTGDRLPAVVCIHGHGGTRASVHDRATVYRGFAADLARRGYVTIACDVGQHAVRDEGATLMGERFADLRRCVDLLRALPEVDPDRIGCAGLSLGGEMAMWLGALDPRVAAVVSCGFLTTMDQLEQGHCRCWNFPGLRELVDWADVYALVAPRPLSCQNGLGEGPRDFCVPLARRAMAEIARSYRDLGAAAAAGLHVHGGGHEVDVPALVGFFDRHLR